jgi:hypothetical protein
MADDTQLSDERATPNTVRRLTQSRKEDAAQDSKQAPPSFDEGRSRLGLRCFRVGESAGTSKGKSSDRPSEGSDSLSEARIGHRKVPPSSCHPLRWLLKAKSLCRPRRTESRFVRSSNRSGISRIGSGEPFIRFHVPLARTGERANRKPLAFNRSPQTLLGTSERSVRSAERTDGSGVRLGRNPVPMHGRPVRWALRGRGLRVRAKRLLATGVEPERRPRGASKNPERMSGREGRMLSGGFQRVAPRKG